MSSPVTSPPHRSHSSRFSPPATKDRRRLLRRHDAGQCRKRGPTPRRLRRAAIDASTVLADAAAAIGDSGPDAASIDTRPDASKDGASDAATRDFYSCAADIDCIAVPKSDAAATVQRGGQQGERDLLRPMFTCPTPNQMCPHFMLNDTRVPECNGGTHKCEMVAIDQIKCGGSGRARAYARATIVA